MAKSTDNGMEMVRRKCSANEIVLKKKISPENTAAHKRRLDRSDKNGVGDSARGFA